MHRQRQGSLYPIVMGVTALIACLAVAGLELSRVAGKANQQLREQLEARRMAQAGLEYWQRQFNAQSLKDPSGPLDVKLDENTGFNVSASLSPLGANSQGAAQVTSVGRYRSAIQRLTARYEARPTLYEGFRTSLYSNDASINHSWSTVYANHWSIAKQNTTSSSSNLFLDAMTGNLFTGTMSNFRQRRIASIPWDMSTASFDPNHAAYPGAAYLNHPGAITIQPPRGGDQLLVNSNFANGTDPWYSNSSALLTWDTTRGYNSSSSARVTNRLSGSDSPVQDISDLLVKNASYAAQVFIRPSATASFRLFIRFHYSPPTSPTTITSGSNTLNGNQWTNLNWNFVYNGTSSQPTKIELGISSNTNVIFNFDTFTLYNQSRNSGIAYIQNVVLSDTYNPFSHNNASPSTAGIYVVDCRGASARIENARIRSTLVFTNCSGVDLRGGIVWDIPNRSYPAIIATSAVTDNTTLDSWGESYLSEWDVAFNVNPTHTPYWGSADSDYSDSFPCFIDGAIFSTSSVSLGNSDSSRGKIRWLTGPILSKESLAVRNTTKDIWFDSNMILNPPPGFYPSFTPMRLIPSSIDEVSVGQEIGVEEEEAQLEVIELEVIELEVIELEENQLEQQKQLDEVALF
jgi:hypothetical protein